MINEKKAIASYSVNKISHLLPIGTVVILKNGNKPIMIYGRKQISHNSQKQFDYLGCLYPEGYISEDYNILFNHSDIEQVPFKGFENEEEKLFRQFLSQI